eukprot:215387_1
MFGQIPSLVRPILHKPRTNIAPDIGTHCSTVSNTLHTHCSPLQPTIRIEIVDLVHRADLLLLWIHIQKSLLPLPRTHGQIRLMEVHSDSLLLHRLSILMHLQIFEHRFAVAATVDITKGL